MLLKPWRFGASCGSAWENWLLVRMVVPVSCCGSVTYSVVLFVQLYVSVVYAEAECTKLLVSGQNANPA